MSIITIVIFIIYKEVMENCDLEIKATTKNPIEMILNYIGETFPYMKITDAQKNELYYMLSYAYNNASENDRDEAISYLVNDKQEIIEDWRQNYADPEEMINFLEKNLNVKYEEYKRPTEPKGNTRLY
ncbi:hypothetical protein IJM86_08925 [bacterium]|nr:hypothetical protein [bacterium]